MPPGRSRRRAFVDRTLEDAFSTDGYVVAPLLSAVEVDGLRQAFTDTHEPSGAGFATDFERLPPAARRRVAERIEPLWAARLPAVLDRHRVFMTSYLAKWADDDSALELHQDWTYIDEDRARGVSIWVAIDDIGPDLDNGPLCVVPGSHLLTDSHRGPATEQWFRPWAEPLRDAAVALTVPAGHAAFIDGRIIHWSPPNRSGSLRLALAGAAIPIEEPLRFVVAEAGDSVRVVDADDELFAESSPTALASAAHTDRRTLVTGPRITRPPDAAEIAARLGRPVAAAPGEELGPSLPPEAGPLVERAATAPMVATFALVRRVDPEAGQPFPSRSRLPWVAALEAAWEPIRDEYRELVGRGLRVPTMEAVADAAMPNQGQWLAFVLKTNAGWIADNVRRAPELARALRGVDGLRAALVSTLGPGATLLPHRGPNKGVLRVHLGLVVPGAPGAVVLRAGDQVAAFAEGRCLVFDDTFEHAVENRTDHPRTTLMLEVDRPLHGRLADVNRVLQASFRWFPQVRGAEERLADLDLALNH